jgi:hypothetical protein
MHRLERECTADYGHQSEDGSVEKNAAYDFATHTDTALRNAAARRIPFHQPKTLACYPIKPAVQRSCSFYDPVSLASGLNQIVLAKLSNIFSRLPICSTCRLSVRLSIVSDAAHRDFTINGQVSPGF